MTPERRPPNDQSLAEVQTLPGSLQYFEGFIPPAFEDMKLSEFTPSPEFKNIQNLPIRVYDHPNKKIRMMTLFEGSPESEVRAFIPGPETFPPELRADITPWNEAVKQVMIDESVMDLIAKVVQNYADREYATIIGPSAVSKSYVAGWILSSLLGFPYYSFTVDGKTEEEEIRGSETMKPKHLLGSPTTILEMVEQRVKSDSLSEVQKKYYETVIKEMSAGIEKSAEYVLTEEFETKMTLLFSMLGLGDPFVRGEIGFQLSPLMEKVMLGYWICIDEINRTTAMNAFTDLIDPTKKSFSLPGLHAKVQRAPGTMIVTTENPESYEGTQSKPYHLQSRESTITLSENNIEFFSKLYEFFIRGNNPAMIVEGKQYRGMTDVQTDYRGQLEKLPTDVVDELVLSLARIHMSVVTMTKEGVIGKKKRKEGGNYVFDQRDIRKVLTTIKSYVGRAKAETTESDGTDANWPSNMNWEVAIKNALYKVYLHGISPSDRERVKTVIDDLPIWNRLGVSLELDMKIGQGIHIKKAPKGKLSFS